MRKIGEVKDPSKDGSRVILRKERERRLDVSVPHNFQMRRAWQGSGSLGVKVGCQRSLCLSGFGQLCVSAILCSRPGGAGGKCGLGMSACVEIRGQQPLDSSLWTIMVSVFRGL